MFICKINIQQTVTVICVSSAYALPSTLCMSASLCVCVCVYNKSREMVEPSVLTTVELIKLSDQLRVNATPPPPHHHLYVTNYNLCVLLCACVYLNEVIAFPCLFVSMSLLCN